MTSPEAKPPEEKPGSAMDLLGMRLWILCVLIIVFAGVLNFLLGRYVGSP